MNRYHGTLNHLRYFQVICANGVSMTNAAQILGYSVCTVSEMIARLERNLQTDLFIRHCRRLELTRAGEALFRMIDVPMSELLKIVSVEDPAQVLRDNMNEYETSLLVEEPA